MPWWRPIVCAFSAACVLPAGGQASFIYEFERITANAAVDVAHQFSVEVSPQNDQADFTFWNTAVIPASITGVYFADGTLLGIASISHSPDVKFSLFASPANLPGGNALDPPFVTTAGFSADSDPPRMHNGVNAGSEWLTITFDLQTGRTFQDVLNDMDSGQLRIGIHVQSIDGDESDSFVALPEPGASLMILAALSIVLIPRRRQKCIVFNRSQR